MRSIASCFVLVAILITPAAAAAAPITVGTWSLFGPPAAGEEIFWRSPGSVCGGEDCSIGAILNNIFGPVEYLHDGSGDAVAFAFEEQVSFTKIGALAAWKGGVLFQDPDGSFTFDTGKPLHVHNSLDQSWQFALFRLQDDPTRYFVGIEDINMTLAQWSSDQDYNDYIASFQVAGTPEPLSLRVASAPEPSSLLLLGAGLALAVRRLRQAI